MKKIFFSSSLDTIKEWQNRDSTQTYIVCYDAQSLQKEIKTSQPYIIIADYDSVSLYINTFISSNTLPANMIILEKSPEVTTGKMLISHNIKAYGNSRMFKIHYEQMIKTVQNGDIWTYPELTATLVKDTNQNTLNQNAKKLLENRLSKKELEVVYLVLEGMTNSAIAANMQITIRTIKSHVSSIFLKLHVSDRISLILLLK